MATCVGFFAKHEDVVWPLKVFVYCLPFRWGLSSFVKSEFKNTDNWKGAIADSTVAAGYTCTGDYKLCFGKTGRQVGLDE